MKPSKILFIVIALLPYLNSMAITVKFKPDSTVGKDAPIFTSLGCKLSYFPTVGEVINFGKQDEMEMMQWTYGAAGCGQGTTRGLVKFTQLSTLPATATIVSAKLNLFGVSSSVNWGTSSFPGSPYTLSNECWVERVTSAWNEHTVTWNTQPSTTITNRVATPSSGSRWNWNTSVDVTTLVNDIRASGVNEGFMLKLQVEAIYRAVLFATSDNADTALWPELVITYLDDPCAGTVADFKDTNTSCYEFQFSDLSKAKDSGIVSRSWDFGDMTSGTGKNPIHTYADYGTYTVRLVVTDSSGCRDTVSKSVTINYRHFVNAGSDTSLCLLNGSAKTLLRGNFGNKTYKWTPDSGALSHSSSASTYATISKSTTFFLTATDSFGCIDKDTVKVNVYPDAIIRSNVHDTAVCINSLIKLKASGGKNYTWFPASGLDSANIPGPNATVTASVQYRVMGVDTNGCIGYDSVSIKLLPSAMVQINPENIKGCAGDTVTLNASGAKYYQWTPAVGLSSDTIPNPVHVFNGKTTYVVRGVNKDGCAGFDTVNIENYPNPVVDAYSNENIARCVGKGVKLYVEGASSYTWSPAEYVNDITSSEPVVTPFQTTKFTVEGKNIFGCTGKDTISVIYEGKSMAYVPNAFTPNNDGINERLGILDQCNFTLSVFKIYNRWGAEIFESHSLTDDWDGTVSGKNCEVGVYYYLIKGRDLEGNSVMFKGDFTLIR